MTVNLVPGERRGYSAGWSRPFVDLLCLWRLCAKPACSRACHGDARICLQRHGQLLPDGVQDWYDGLCDAQARREPFNDAMEALDATEAGDALRDWHEAVSASLGEKGGLEPRWWTIDQR